MRNYFNRIFIFVISSSLLSCSCGANVHGSTNNSLRGKDESKEPLQPKFCGARLAESAVRDYLKILSPITDDD